MNPRQNPAAAQRPAPYDGWAIVEDPTLDIETKRQRLRELEQLARQLQVATGEGMEPGGDSQVPSLSEVLAALAKLDQHG